MSHQVFTNCPSCSNHTPGATIYKCKKCGKIYCKACMPPSKCESCQVDWTDWSGQIFRFKTLGYIK